MPKKHIHKKSKSILKKRVIAKRPEQPKKQEVISQEKIDEKKTFKFEFDEFIIENAPEHIKMFAKPDANLQGEKQFQIKITKDETGKAQFDIVFIKSTEENIGHICENVSPNPPDNDKFKSIVITPDDHKIDLINSPSSSMPPPRKILSSFPIAQRPVLPVNTEVYSHNAFQSPYEPSYANRNDINRYDNIKNQLIFEKGEYPRHNNIHYHSFPHPSNVQQKYRPLEPLVNPEYMPDDFFNSIETIDSLEPLEPPYAHFSSIKVHSTPVPPKATIKEFPLSQLKSDAKSPFLLKDSEGRQYLVEPISHDEQKDNEEPSTSKYVPNGESKIKINKKVNPIMRKETGTQIDSIEIHQEFTKNTDSIDKVENNLKSNRDGLDKPKETMKKTESQNQKYKSSPNLGNVSHPSTRVMMKPTESKVDTNETNDTSQSSSVTLCSIPSECNFVIESACQKIPADKRKLAKVVFAEILDYFKNDLIKSLIGQKISEEREFIVKHMNHKGLEKKEFIQKELKTQSLCENETHLIEGITAKIKEVNVKIMELLDHKIYDENSHLMLIIEQQLEKSKDLIIRETCTECFIAIKYCTTRILQDNLRLENKFIKKEVELNLNKELEMTLEKIKSNCSKYYST
ncbi:hypothetical protein WDU94_011544 [Cyamophila willieti]